MFRFIGLCFGTLVRLLRARRALLLENLALRQQLAVLKRRHSRPRLDLIDKVRRPAGRRQTSKEVRELIFRMVAENPTWGAPRIHCESLMLGFDVSERTVSRWMNRAPRDPEPATRWLTFLRNHREAIAAMDFFTVPTITFSRSIAFSL